MERPLEMVPRGSRETYVNVFFMVYIRMYGVYQGGHLESSITLSL